MSDTAKILCSWGAVLLTVLFGLPWLLKFLLWYFPLVVGR